MHIYTPEISFWGLDTLNWKQYQRNPQEAHHSVETCHMITINFFSNDL